MTEHEQLRAPKPNADVPKSAIPFYLFALLGTHIRVDERARDSRGRRQRRCESLSTAGERKLNCNEAWLQPVGRHPSPYPSSPVLTHTRPTPAFIFIPRQPHSPRRNWKPRKLNRNKRLAGEEDKIYVLAAISSNLQFSSRVIARRSDIAQASVLRILLRHKFHLYHVSLHEELHGNNFNNPVNFCTKGIRHDIPVLDQIKAGRTRVDKIRAAPQKRSTRTWLICANVHVVEAPLRYRASAECAVAANAFHEGLAYVHQCTHSCGAAAVHVRTCEHGLVLLLGGSLDISVMVAQRIVQDVVKLVSSECYKIIGLYEVDMACMFTRPDHSRFYSVGSAKRHCIQGHTNYTRIHETTNYRCRFASSSIVPSVSLTLHCTDARSPQTSLPLLTLITIHRSSNSSEARRGLNSLDAPTQKVPCVTSRAERGGGDDRNVLATTNSYIESPRWQEAERAPIDFSRAITALFLRWYQQDLNLESREVEKHPRKVGLRRSAQQVSRVVHLGPTSRAEKTPSATQYCPHIGVACCNLAQSSRRDNLNKHIKADKCSVFFFWLTEKQRVMTSVPPVNTLHKMFADDEGTSIMKHCNNGHTQFIQGDTMKEHNKICKVSPTGNQQVMSPIPPATSMGIVSADDHDETSNANDGMIDLRGMIVLVCARRTREVDELQNKLTSALNTDDDHETPTKEISDEKFDDSLDVLTHFTNEFPSTSGANRAEGFKNTRYIFSEDQNDLIHRLRYFIVLQKREDFSPKILYEEVGYETIFRDFFEIVHHWVVRQVDLVSFAGPGLVRS
ncbi:hypothetical protein PR048_023818 [Dryococelus australis]|uniref:Uncharacterized protein n=1 Tax=Dryococelus australis TaxID=614101 RepID=A0ABQ9GV34_9NEOP|nr:hypothetical protein PR048_023818 [Dryococelus australis]